MVLALAGDSTMTRFISDFYYSNERGVWARGQKKSTARRNCRT